MNTHCEIGVGGEGGCGVRSGHGAGARGLRSAAAVAFLDIEDVTLGAGDGDGGEWSCGDGGGDVLDYVEWGGDKDWVGSCVNGLQVDELRGGC